MKFKLLLFLMSFVSIVNAQVFPTYWSVVPENTLEKVKGKTPQRVIIPNKYLCVKVESAAWKDDLLSAPQEKKVKDYSDGKLVVLPMPSGESMEFLVWQYDIMESRLAEKYPDTKTFLGYAVHNPAVKVRMGYSPSGMYASVKGGGYSWHIDPYSLGNTDYCIVYRQQELQNVSGFQCYDHSEDADHPFNAPIVQPTPRRDFRLAMAATGEYTGYFGGKSNAMNEIVKLVNRLNQIYETDLNIRFILINNNDQIVYTNPNTDPYTSEMLYTLINQNIANLNAVIDTANYDIGHVVDYCDPYSRYGGGLALNGVVCTKEKAGGATSYDSPSGDPFYVSYVAHEIGHQFSAMHTFNTTQSSCGGGNRVAASAYEPGSGSTVMAYAGICEPDNLQDESDAYFHVHSILQINYFVATKSCYTIEPMVNSSPEIVSMPLANKIIPKSTPFKLKGTATDADGDSLTYCWEEYDLGPTYFLSETQTTGTAPLFRSFLPSISPVRYFPRLDSLVLKRNTPQEQLPGYARNMKFMLTVRDGNGAVVCDSVSFHVDNNSGPFEVTYPDNPVVLNSESSLSVTWNVAGTQSGVVSCQHVNILLSVDGGFTYPYLLLANASNTGTALVTVPSLMRNSDKCRIMVEAADNLFFNISPQNFTIKASAIIPVYAEVSTDTALYISQTSTTLQGSVKSSGNVSIVETGFYYGTQPFSDSIAIKLKTMTPVQEGVFILNIGELNQNQTYYYRAYAVNSVGKSLGELKSFHTNSIISRVDAEQLNRSEVKIYPNPSEGIIIITTQVEKINKIEIKNVLGISCKYQEFVPSSIVNVDISGLSGGVYICDVYTDKGIISKKIVKK